MEQHQKAMALQESLRRSVGEEAEGSGTPNGSGRWRENVLGAKKKAWKTLAPMMKLQVWGKCTGECWGVWECALQQVEGERAGAKKTV